jgi:predicted dehydrogenase
MVTNDKLNFALVGCGRIAVKHADVLSRLKGASLTAVCDLNEEKAREYSEKYKVPYYVDYREMLESEPSIDVVNVLTENGNNARIAIDVANFQKHLVIEKPMALTLEDADAIIEACDASGCRLFVVKQNRLNVPIVKLRQALEEGRFGKLILGAVRVRWCRRPEYYKDSWHGTWEMSGGVLTDQAIHHIDLLVWMFGDVESVYAKSTTALADIETEDTGVVILKFMNGALGTIEATTATRPTNTEGSLSVLGANGMVEIGGFAVNEMKTWQFENKLEGDDEVLSQCKSNPPDVYGFGHYEYLKGVIDCIKKNRKALVDGLEGRKSLELLHAIYESIETRREVVLRFRPEKNLLGQKPR